MSDTDDGSKHSYSTGTSGGGSSAASDTSDAAALNALQDRRWACRPKEHMQHSQTCNHNYCYSFGYLIELLSSYFVHAWCLDRLANQLHPTPSWPPSDNDESLNDLLGSNRKLDEGVRAELQKMLYVHLRACACVSACTFLCVWLDCVAWCVCMCAPTNEPFMAGSVCALHACTCMHLRMGSTCACRKATQVEAI